MTSTWSWSGLRSWVVHGYTATGAVLALLIVLAAVEGDVARALWLGLAALVIDGTDHTFARLLTEVAACAGVLRAFGVEVGDEVSLGPLPAETAVVAEATVDERARARIRLHARLVHDTARTAFVDEDCAALGERHAAVLARLD